jgi:hypothetical protein
MKQILNKGEVKNPATNFELHDTTSAFDPNNKVLSAYGGAIQQFYYLFQAILDLHGDDLSSYYRKK